MVKKKAEKPIVHKAPLSYSVILWIIIITFFVSFGICIGDSFEVFSIKNVSLFQGLLLSDFSFLLGFLTGGNLSK